jgi:hypothetical protein
MAQLCTVILSAGKAVGPTAFSQSKDLFPLCGYHEHVKEFSFDCGGPEETPLDIMCGAWECRDPSTSQEDSQANTPASLRMTSLWSQLLRL